jgi:hypothetical protein
MGKKFAFTLIFLAAAIFIFRHLLISTTIEIAIRTFTGEKLQYEKRRWEGERLIYDKLSLGEGVYAEHGEVAFYITKSPFYLEAHLVLTDLDLVVDPKEERAPIFAALIPQRFFGIKLDVEGGRMAIVGDDRPMTFTFLSHPEREKIGTCRIDDLLIAEINYAEKDWNIAWRAVEAPIERLMQLARIFSPNYAAQWTNFKGVAEIQGRTVFKTEGKEIELAMHLEAKEVAAASEALGIFGGGSHVQMDVEYPEFSLRANIDGGEIHLTEPLTAEKWSLVDGKGLLVMERDKEPSIELQGKLLRGESSYPLKIQGKGGAESKEIFWIESEIEIATSSATISLCQPEVGKFVVQADIRNLAEEGLALAWEWSSFLTPLAKQMTVPRGRIAMQMTAWWEEKKLKKVQFENIKAADFYVESSTLPFQGFLEDVTGSLFLHEEHIERADLEIKGAAVRYSQWHASDIGTHLKIEANSFVDSGGKGSFGGISSEFTLLGAVLSPQIEVHLSASPSQWLGIFMEVPQGSDESLIHLFATYQGKKVHGHFSSGEEVVHFAWEKEGSFKSGKISEQTYAPFLRTLYLDSCVMGDFSIEGNFDTRHLTCSLKGQNIRLQWRQLSMELDKLEEMELSCNFETQKWKGSGKLFDAQGKDSASGLTIENFEGNVALLEEGIRLDSFKGHCSGPIEGLFSEGWLQLRAGDRLYWSTRLHFQEGTFSCLKGIACDLEYDASANIAVIRNSHAAIGEIALASQMIRLKDKRLDFDLKVGEWLDVKGDGKRTGDDTFCLQLSGEGNKTALLNIANNKIVFEVKYDKVKAQGEANLLSDTLLCEFFSIEGVLPSEYHLKSASPLQFSFHKGIGQLDFIAIDRATQRVVGEIKGDGLDHVSCFFHTLKASFGIKMALPELILQNGKDALVISTTPWKLDGCFQGMEIHLFQDKGWVKIVDGKKAGQFFSYDWLKELKGIELVGVWKKGGFKGEVCGKEFEFKGRKFEELKGEAEITPQKAVFKNVEAIDTLGKVFLKQIAYDHGKIEIPLVKIQNFRPRPEKPFMIRTLVLSELKMIAGDLKTLQGKGSFNFTNSWKRESSIFDAPIEMLKDLGLDPALFTPIGGEVSCLLKNGKLYLTELSNAYSEGERSQFFLANDLDPSYIDLDGLFHINLRMKQNAVLKFAEPFTLTIRGPLEKPEYSLR